MIVQEMKDALKVWGRSQTTWTDFWPFSTNPPTLVDSGGLLATPPSCPRGLDPYLPTPFEKNLEKKIQ